MVRAVQAMARKIEDTATVRSVVGVTVEAGSSNNFACTMVRIVETGVRMIAIPVNKGVTTHHRGRLSV